MSENKSALIIGAGIGGIATAVFLAKNGYFVNVFEKNDQPGGRCGQIIRDGYRFDLGATMLMMPGIYRKVFSSLGIPLFENNDVQRLDDLYQVFFDDNTSLNFTTNEGKMKEQLEAIESGSFLKSKKYVEDGYEIFELGINKLIGRNFDSLFQFTSPKNALLLLKLKVHINNVAYARKFFRHPHLLMAYTFQNIYVGQDPHRSPALFSMIPAAELTEGSYSPDGGMYGIVEKLMTEARNAGVLFHFNSPVSQIITDGDKAEGIMLENGTRIRADVVVANADLPFVYRKLLPDRHKSTKLDRLKYSCSAVSFHWGIDKTYSQLSRHNVFLTDDYKEGLKTIFRDKSVGSNPCFYLHAPGRFDPSAAPAGHDAISVVVGSGHVDPSANQDWEEIAAKTRTAVINRLKKLGMEDIEDHIKTEVCILPSDWEDTCNITRGSVFGSLAHNILQMGYFRPHNQHSRYRNLYFAGGSTQPGNGIPNVLLSAKLTSERILGKAL